MIYYFVTQSEKFGNSMILEPRIPISIDVDLNENNTIPRICVAPSIKQCLDAIQPNIYKLNNINIYICKINEEDENLVYHPTVKEVPDVLDTEEVWLLKPTYFEKIRSIKYDINDEIDDLYNKI